jgi:LysM repeat protein
MIKLLFVLAISLNTEVSRDSIGVETINGQLFVIHRVEEKETLYAMSRRYRTTVDDILRYNTSAGAGLEIGQILKVPYKEPVPKPAGGIVHTVASKETVYSISRTYQVSMEDIRQWNNLRDNAIGIGQQLIIKKSTSKEKPASQPLQQESPAMISKKGFHTVQPKETLFSIARQYDVSVDELKAWNSLSGPNLTIGQTLFVLQPEQKTADKPVQKESASSTQADEIRRENEVKETGPIVKNTVPPAKGSSNASSGQSAESIRISESLKNGDEIIEGGLAELIEGTEGNRKYLALHRTAPMGTILKVRNQMNNREVFVRVMGKLPDTVLTDKLIIKISRSAYDRLGAIDPRFRVEVTYYK